MSLTNIGLVNHECESVWRSLCKRVKKSGWMFLWRIEIHLFSRRPLFLLSLLFGRGAILFDITLFGW